MKRGSVSILSHYCPLDLFSGCHLRQRKAIENLLETPQNNLRIFKNLKLVYGEEKRISFTNVFSNDINTNFEQKVQLNLTNLCNSGGDEKHELNEEEYKKQHLLHEQRENTDTDIDTGDLKFIESHEHTQSETRDVTLNENNCEKEAIKCITSNIDTSINYFQSTEREKNNIGDVNYELSSTNEQSVKKDDDDDTKNNGFFDHQSETLVKDLYISLILKALNVSSKQLTDSVSNLNPKTEDGRKIMIDESSICQLHSILSSDSNLKNNSTDDVVRIEDSLATTFNSNCYSNCDCTEHFLNSHSVLGSVYSGQKLDSVDSSRALDLARYLVKRNSNLILDLKMKQPPIIGSPCRLQTETLDEFYFRKVWEFVVSLTAKDCSIMITMQKVNELPSETSSSESSSGNCDEDAVEEEEEEVSSELDLCDSNDSSDLICPRQEVVVDGCDDELANVVDGVNGHKGNCFNDASDDVSQASTSSLENAPFVMSQFPLHEQIQQQQQKPTQQSNGLHLIRDDVSGQLFAIAIAITDLDPKLPQTYPELERKINQKDYLMVQSFKEFLNKQPFSGAIYEN